MTMPNPILVSLFAVILIVIGVLAIRRRVLFKMGVRNFIRHKTHSILVVAGLLIGTSIISGALVTGDSIDHFIVKSSYDGLGLVDVTVSTDRMDFFNESFFWELRNDTGVEEHSDGISPTILTFVSVEDDDSGQFEPVMTFVGFDPSLDRDFGQFTEANGSETYAYDLGTDEVILNGRAADVLNAEQGDMLRISYRPLTLQGGEVLQKQFETKYVVKDEGKGQYGLQANIFVRLDVAQQMFNVSGRINLIRISAPGDVEAGAGNSDELVAAVQDALDSSPDQGSSELSVDAVKKDALEQAEETGEMFSIFLMIFGSFSIIAGVILIINIFTMLAEERKSELGMARALGMRKSHLMQMFLFEGSSYALVAALLGTLAGLFLAATLIFGLNSVFAIGEFGGIPFRFEISSLIDAFCLGTIIAFLTILVASARITNINIVRAIRDIEEPVFDRATTKTAILGGVTLALGLVAFFLGYENLIIRLVAPCLALMGFAFVLRRFASASIAFTISGIAIIAYILHSITTFFEGEMEEMAYLFIVSGVLLVIAAVMIVIFNSSLLVRGVSGSLGRIRSMRPIVRTAVSHPLNKRFRTGMTVSMFALVIYTIVLLSVFSNIFSLSVSSELIKQGGGYEIIGTSTIPVSDLNNVTVIDAEGNPVRIESPTLANDVRTFEQIVATYPNVTIDGVPLGGTGGGPMGGGPMGFGLGRVLGVDNQFIQNNQYVFAEMLEGYTDPHEAWDAIQDNHTNVIVDLSITFAGGSGMQGGNGITVGDHLTIETVNGTKDFQIVGILDQMLLNGIFMTKENAQAYFSDSFTVHGNSVFIFGVKDGADAKTVTLNLERDFRAIGMDTRFLKEDIESMMEMLNSFFLIFEIFLGLGLIVGIAGLGVITIRSVVERRQEIGVMRAIGFRRGMILKSFVTEILFIATLGIVIGTAIGLTVAYEIFASMMAEEDVSFSIPWMHLLTITLITYVASLACTIVPSIKASRTSPADALRYMG